jgi:Hypervirulence associated proteins TUDOR domain/Caudovirus prohead serine protease
MTPPQAVEKIAPFTRTLEFRKESAPVVTEDRVVSMSISSAQRVTRYDWERWEPFEEELSHDPKHVRLDRINNGICPLLFNHWRDDQRGAIISANFDGKRGTAEAKISRSDKGEQLLLDLQDGIAKGVSIGYRVYEYEVVSEAEYETEGRYQRIKKMAVYRAIDWEIYEVSICTMPADITVGVGRSYELEPNPVKGLFLSAKDERADVEDLAVGDWVKWQASGGTARGKIEQIVTNGKATPKPKGNPINGTKDNPAYLCSVYKETDDVWKDSGVRTVHRASALSKINPLNTASKKMDETELEQMRSQLDTLSNQVGNLSKQIEEKDKEIANLRRTQTVKDKYNALRQRGEALVNEAKLSSAEFRDIFNDFSDTDIDRLLRANIHECDGELNSIEFYLNKSGKRTPLLNLESRTGNTPLPDRTSPEDKSLRDLQEAQTGYQNAWRS